MTKIIVKIPTKNRGTEFLHTYLNFSNHKETQFVISVDEDDEFLQEWKDLDIKNVKVKIGKPAQTKVEAFNRDIPSTKWDVMIVGSDDFLPICLGYDTRVAELVKQHGRNKLIWFMQNDTQPFCTFPIIGRDLYERLGYVYHPGYKAFFCDADLTKFCLRSGVLVRVKEKWFEHFHPAWDTRKSDKLDKQHEGCYHEDKLFYEKRRKKGF